MELGPVLYDGLNNKKRKKALKSVIFFSSILIFIGLIIFILIYTHEDPPPVIVIIFFPSLYIGTFVGVILMNYFQNRRGLKIYENAVVFPSIIKGKEQIVPFSKIKVVFWNPDEKFITFFITLYNNYRKKWINIGLPFEKRYISDIARVKMIIKNKTNLIEDRNKSYNDLKKWEKSEPLLE